MKRFGSYIYRRKQQYLMKSNWYSYVRKRQIRELDFNYWLYGTFQNEQELREELEQKLTQKDYLLDSCMNAQMINIVRKAIESLQPKFQQIIYRKFFLNDTLRSIANDYGVCTQRVHQWQYAALQQLKHFSYKGKQLSYYLNPI